MPRSGPEVAFRWCAAALRAARAWWAAVLAAITSFEFVFAFFHAPLCAMAPADGSAGSDAVCRSSATVILSAGGFHRERTRRAPAPPSARGMPNGSCDQSCSSARRRCASGLTGRGAGDAPLCGGTPGLSMIVRGSVPKPIPVCRRTVEPCTGTGGRTGGSAGLLTCFDSIFVPSRRMYAGGTLGSGWCCGPGPDGFERRSGSRSETTTRRTKDQRSSAPSWAAAGRSSSIFQVEVVAAVLRSGNRCSIGQGFGRN